MTVLDEFTGEDRKRGLYTAITRASSEVRVVPRTRNWGHTTPVPRPAYGRIRALADPTRGGSGQTVADVGEGHGARRFVTPSILSAGVQFATVEQLPVQLLRTGPD